MDISKLSLIGIIAIYIPISNDIRVPFPHNLRVHQILNLRHLRSNEMICQCGLKNFHFFEWDGASFHIFKGHLPFLVCELLIFLCPFCHKAWIFISRINSWNELHIQSPQFVIYLLTLGIYFICFSMKKGVAVCVWFFFFNKVKFYLSFFLLGFESY